jgi:hypothetical protein
MCRGAAGICAGTSKQWGGWYRGRRAVGREPCALACRRGTLCSGLQMWNLVLRSPAGGRRRVRGPGYACARLAGERQGAAGSVNRDAPGISPMQLLMSFADAQDLRLHHAAAVRGLGQVIQERQCEALAGFGGEKGEKGEEGEEGEKGEKARRRERRERRKRRKGEKGEKGEGRQKGRDAVNAADARCEVCASLGTSSGKVSGKPVAFCVN